MMQMSGERSICLENKKKENNTNDKAIIKKLELYLDSLDNKCYKAMKKIYEYKKGK